MIQMIRADGVIVEIEEKDIDKIMTNFLKNGWTFRDPNIQEDIHNIEIPLGGLEAAIESKFFQETIDEKGDFLVFGNYRETQYWFASWSIYHNWILARFDMLLGKGKWEFDPKTALIKIKGTMTQNEIIQKWIDIIYANKADHLVLRGLSGHPRFDFQGKDAIFYVKSNLSEGENASIKMSQRELKKFVKDKYNVLIKHEEETIKERYEKEYNEVVSLDTDKLSYEELNKLKKKHEKEVEELKKKQTKVDYHRWTDEDWDLQNLITFKENVIYRLIIKKNQYVLKRKDS